MKKEKENNSDEESELEEILDEEVSDEEQEFNIDENQFQEFFQISRSSAPVLEEIDREQELGGRIFFTPGMDAKTQDNDDVFRYDAQAQENNEPKYHGDYASVTQNIESIDTAKIGRDITSSHTQEVGFAHSFEQNDSPTQEKYQEAQRIDMEKIRRENPFETRFQKVERKKSEYVVK